MGGSMLKPRDVEEWIDYRLHRPLAELLVGLLEHSRITPNQLTFLSGGVGLLAGLVMFWAPGQGSWLIAAGGGLLFLSIILDCADGQLARRRGEHSLVGRALDGFIDPIAPIAVCHGLGFYMVYHELPIWYVFLLGWTAGFSFAMHTNYYDHAKNVYLHNTMPQIDMGGRPLLDLEAIEEELQHSRQQRRYFMIACLWFFRIYTRGQRKRGKSKIEQGAPITSGEEERRIYREVFHRSMRLWSCLGLGTHLAALVLSALLSPIWPPITSVTWWVFLVPGNLLQIYLVLSQPAKIRDYERRVAIFRQGASEGS